MQHRTDMEGGRWINPRTFTRTDPRTGSVLGSGLRLWRSLSRLAGRFSPRARPFGRGFHPPLDEALHGGSKVYCIQREARERGERERRERERGERERGERERGEKKSGEKKNKLRALGERGGLGLGFAGWGFEGRKTRVAFTPRLMNPCMGG